MRELLSGNEAVARGAYEAGVKLAASYPGTPSTEILETLAERFPSIYSQWSPNEKVAFEVAIGASIGGARALVTMKHVGLNVAADPYMTFAYTGVGGGLVVVSCDDPEMHSSQNEQDNRFYARMAQVPFLAPSDSQEAKDMLITAYEMSEIFDTPVMLHMTTRISHSKAVVELGERVSGPDKRFIKDQKKYVMIPAHARLRHVVVEDRLEKLRHFTEETPYNRVENNGSDIGIITGGVSYQYCKEVAPDFDYFKIGMGYPLPFGKIEQFIKAHKRVMVVEELEPFYEDMIRAYGMKVEGKKFTGTLGELSPYRVALAFKEAGLIDKVEAPEISSEEFFPRPPVLCPGCPHRGAFMALKKLGVAVAGDIGCYTLGVTEPLNAMDTCICMGASIGNAIGMEKVQGSKTGTVAVIGDSTFIHSGITGLLDAVYNKSNVTVMILDNRATAMTGGQQHPGTGKTLMGEDAARVDLFKLCQALGVESVRELDAYDYDAAVAMIKEEMARPGPSVIITTRPCVLMPVRIMDEPYVVDMELCNGCSACFRISCPAIAASHETNKHGHPKAVIDDTMCTGCTLCAQICPTEAIILKSHFVKTEVTR
ncbi:MAG: indolepyruvate ferredoxin oxidoreductase subunit alpha [candidate division Zixibacteria bacterium]|nr:indolepyruvate ferredoxin oxidoreductase subunit alpha [candidate division Zixibacteria bacterium]